MSSSSSNNNNNNNNSRNRTRKSVGQSPPGNHDSLSSSSSSSTSARTAYPDRRADSNTNTNLNSLAAALSATATSTVTATAAAVSKATIKSKSSCAKSGCCLPTGNSNSNNDSSGTDDSKYHKRLRQRRQKRFQTAVFLGLVAFCLLGYTFFQILRMKKRRGGRNYSSTNANGYFNNNNNQGYLSNSNDNYNDNGNDNYNDNGNSYDNSNDNDNSNSNSNDNNEEQERERQIMTRRRRQEQRQKLHLKKQKRDLKRWSEEQREHELRHERRHERGHRDYPRGVRDDNHGADASASASTDDGRFRDDGVQQQQRQRQRRNIEAEDDEQEEEEEDQDPDSVMRRRLEQLAELNKRMESNTNKSIRWADMSDVPALPGQRKRKSLLFHGNNKPKQQQQHKSGANRKFFQVRRSETIKMAWEKEYDAILAANTNIINNNNNKKDVASVRSNYVDYVHHKYDYPREKLMEPPKGEKRGEYPKLLPYKIVMDIWPQDNLDNPPPVLKEHLMHFDWNDPDDMKAALKFRAAKLPFKLINVPELLAATQKWTDDYIAAQFDSNFKNKNASPDAYRNGPLSNGKCNEGPDNFFAFFNPPLWDVMTLGIPPTRDNDWTFERWAKHAHYADLVGLDPNLPHYYWQSGVPKEERFKPKSKWTFVSRDLHSFSDTKPNFVQWIPENQKGIQCRFGERGITAANHYDSGRNMIGMITGAKRYILSPPRACKKLGIVSSKEHSSFRHSMLNYGHMSLLDLESTTMPREEREWMEMAGTADAVSTVVKEGEILYVPTGWFHYITSLQKSAQCNVRSGPDMSGDKIFGGAQDIKENCFPQED